MGAGVFSPRAHCLYLAADLFSCIPKLVLYEPFLHFLHEMGHFWLQLWDKKPRGARWDVNSLVSPLFKVTFSF